MNNLQVVTVSNQRPWQDYYCWDQYFASVRRHGVEPIVLGQKEGEYKGLGDKPRLVLKAIKDGTINSKYIIFTDSWDLVFATHPQNILTGFRFFNSPFVISAEKNCFPLDHKEAFDSLEAPTPYKYVNSGFIVAETEAMLVLLEAMGANDTPDDYRKEDGNWVHANDQLMYHKAFIDQPIKMVMDHNQILCQTLHNAELNEFEFSPHGIKNIETGSFPMSFHLNGGGKSGPVRDPLLKHLGL